MFPNSYFKFFFILWLFTTCSLFTCIPESSSIMKDGAKIYYEVQGTNMPVLIFVHGWSCDRTYWKDQTAYFSKTYKVVTIDLAGHGRSGLNREEWSIANFGEDVATVVNELDLKQVVLVGHSLGGAVVMEAALRLPEQVIGIVGVDSQTLLDPTTNPSRLSIYGLLAGLRSNFKETMQMFVEKYLFLSSSDPSLVKRVAMDMSEQDPEIGIKVYEELFNWQQGRDWETIQQINKPISLINSDKRLPNIKVYSKFANFRFRQMSRVGHFIMMEDPETFNRLLNEEIENFIHKAT